MFHHEYGMLSKFYLKWGTARNANSDMILIMVLIRVQSKTFLLELLNSLSKNVKDQNSIFELNHVQVPLKLKSALILTFHKCYLFPFWKKDVVVL